MRAENPEFYNIMREEERNDFGFFNKKSKTHHKMNEK